MVKRYFHIDLHIQLHSWNLKLALNTRKNCELCIQWTYAHMRMLKKPAHLLNIFYLSASIFSYQVNHFKAGGHFWERCEKELFSPIPKRVHPVKPADAYAEMTEDNVKWKIILLQKSHYELTQICYNMGALFTPPVVMTVLYTSLQLLVTAFMALRMVLYEDIEVVKLATYTKWSFVSIIRLLSLLFAFSWIEKEVISCTRWKKLHFEMPIKRLCLF